MLSLGFGPQLNRVRAAAFGGAPPSAAAAPTASRSKSASTTMPTARPQVMLLSATMPPAVVEAAEAWLVPGHADVRLGGSGPAAGATAAGASFPPGLVQTVHVCAEHKKPTKLLRHLEKLKAAAAGARVPPRVVVFVNRVKAARFVHGLVAKAGYRAELLHGQRPQREREASEVEGVEGEGKRGRGRRRRKREVAGAVPSHRAPNHQPSTHAAALATTLLQAALRAFRAGAAQVLVATDVGGRGLHGAWRRAAGRAGSASSRQPHLHTSNPSHPIPPPPPPPPNPPSEVSGLAAVVNYDFPTQLDAYVHRAGRAARGGGPGHAYSFFTRPLAPLARPTAGLLAAHGQAVDPNLLRLADAYDEARKRTRGEEEGEGEEEQEEEEAEGEEAGVDGGSGEQAVAADSHSDVSDPDAPPPPVVVTRHVGDAALGRTQLPGLYKARRPSLATAHVPGLRGGGASSDDDGAQPAVPHAKGRKKAVPGRLRKRLKMQAARGS